MRLHPMIVLSFVCTFVLGTVHAQTPPPTPVVRISLASIPGTLTVQLVDAEGKLIALVDGAGVVTVVPGERLSHATRVLVTMPVGSMIATYSLPYTADAASEK
ncbi:hypothetical protein MF271_23860 (plasmid) [Deinococcus sp. KNUC1210]|uniref:hypothetical protein n=1 Tax=Deinococcus sp. KNUC1210 TaxID=2917691 RepID=UPI001EF01D76|nr:hypothetical protein [Deinococcus sp. KNUC1210]ULH18000.1 hypothetical protein MF271_23860 [Deinococcus sp. KNUC1210]